MDENNLLKDFKCQDCGRNLEKIDIIYKQETYDRFITDFENETLTVDFGDIIESEVLRYECGECGAILSENIVNIIEEFEQD